MSAPTVIVMAKECVPGRVKTRLHPPFSLEQAARIARASLDDTVTRVRQVDVRRVLCVQGRIGEVTGFDQVPQVGGGLDERIADVIDRVRGPVLLIGMDTPQLDPDLLQRLVSRWPEDVDAWFGPAADGGFWLLGLRELQGRIPAGMRRGDLVRGVPMSRSDTGAAQRRRLCEAGLRVVDVSALTDIDDVDSLREVRPLLGAESALSQLLAELDPPVSAEVGR